jgi:hypothetical protein
MYVHGRKRHLHYSSTSYFCYTYWIKLYKAWGDLLKHEHLRCFPDSQKHIKNTPGHLALAQIRTRHITVTCQSAKKASNNSSPLRTPQLFRKFVDTYHLPTEDAATVVSRHSVRQPISHCQYEDTCISTLNYTKPSKKQLQHDKPGADTSNEPGRKAAFPFGCKKKRKRKIL